MPKICCILFIVTGKGLLVPESFSRLRKFFRAHNPVSDSVEL
jgi:hypothetical protein